MALFDVTDKVVVVTGSARGNGLAIARGFAEARARVVRVDLQFDESSRIAVADDKAFDLREHHRIPDLVGDIIARYGRIDALINNAGVSISRQDPYEISVLEETISVNLRASYKLCGVVCPIMASQGAGSIVNITSLGAELGFPDNPSYQVSKAGLKQLTRAIARDWGRRGVRANNVCPGYIRTSMTTRSYNDPNLREQRSRRMMLDRWGVPEDLVGPCIFLVADASAYILGSDIYVDGGWRNNGL